MDEGKVESLQNEIREQGLDCLIEKEANESYWATRVCNHLRVTK